MKQPILTKTLLIAAVFGLATASKGVAAEGSLAADSAGLLGQAYGGLTFSTTDLHGTSLSVDHYSFEYNLPITADFDANFGYDYGQSGTILGSRVKQHLLGASVRAYSTNAWGKPYIEAGLGYTNVRYAGSKEGSYLWALAVGAEFQVAPAFSVTPYVQYSDAPDIGGSEGTWDFGVKANYWLTRRIAIVGDISRNDDKDMNYAIGLNFRF